MTTKKVTKPKGPHKRKAPRVDVTPLIPVGLTLTEWMAEQDRIRENTEHVKQLFDPSAPARKMTPEMKLAYCLALSKMGRQTHAAAVIGVVPETIQRHRKIDPEFDAAVARAHRAYADWVISKVQDMAFNGVVTERKIVYDEQGEEDGIIVKRAFLPALVQMEARRVEPDYRDKQEVKVDVTQSHVLMVPEQAKSTEDWEAFAIEQQVSKPDDE